MSANYVVLTLSAVGVGASLVRSAWDTLIHPRELPAPKGVYRLPV
jgi:hypothetical protein